MKKFLIGLFYFSFLFGSGISLSIEGKAGTLYNPYLQKEIKNHLYPSLKEYLLGFSFGIEIFKPDEFFIRGKFSEDWTKGEKDNLRSFFDAKEFLLEGGMEFRKDFLSIYPVIGIGMELQEVKLDKRFEGKSYTGLIGLETRVILTREKPGYLSLFLRGDAKKIGGTYLDADFDFIISPPHFQFSLSLGLIMGYFYR